MTFQNVPMLGQYFSYQIGFCGSIFKNEMLFHMYTRTKNGFCGLCDLEPENILENQSDQEGYKLPGHLFHSKASEFKDPLFPNWQCDQLFVDTSENHHILTSVFQYDPEDPEGNAMKRCLTFIDILKLVCGAEDLSPCCKEFFFSQDSQVGLRVEHRLGYTGQSPAKLPKEHFRLNFDGMDPTTLPLEVVSGVFVGYNVFARFYSETMSIEELEVKVKLFGEVFKKQEESLPKPLLEVPGCTIQIHIGNYRKDLDTTKIFQNFESSFEHIKTFDNNMKKINCCRWINYDCVLWGIKLYLDFMIGEKSGIHRKSERIRNKVRLLPKFYQDLDEEHIHPHNLYKLYKDVALVLKEIDKYNNIGPIRYLNGTLENGIKNSQKRLARAIDAYRTRQGSENCVRSQLDEFNKSELNLIQLSIQLIQHHTKDIPRCSVNYSAEPKNAVKRVNFLLGYVCPSSWDGGCPSHYQRLNCSGCDQLLRFNPCNSEVNCQCGTVSLRDCTFRCNHPKHGVLPNSMDLLLRKNPRAEINCLLIGESGAGKSTLLNSLVNYMLYESLEEAEHKDPIFLIPTAYTSYTDEYNEITHPFGSDDNEQLMDGRTHTLSFRNYVIPLTEIDKVIRFIDSPGFDPVSEIMEDHLESYLEVAARHHDLHAICWVINSNQKKLSQGFLSAFRRMTSLLATDQLNSFLFVFTHFTHQKVNIQLVRQVKDLQAGLNQNQVFRVNNEAFLHLVSRLAGQTIQDHELTRVRYIWEESSKACKEFFDCLSKMDPRTFLERVKEDLDYNPFEEVVFQTESFKVSCMLQLKMSGLSFRLTSHAIREKDGDQAAA